VSRKGREIDLWYSGKKKDFGGNIQGLFYPGGLPMWISDVLPGNVHDLAAARENVLPVLRNYTDEMPALADCGYEGAGHGVLTPVKKPKGVQELDIRHAHQEYAAELGAMPGRKRLRAAFPALEDTPERHRRPQRDRAHRACGPCPGAIRAQATRVKVAEKTSMTDRLKSGRSTVRSCP
jgi:hypothetical protein